MKLFKWLPGRQLGVHYRKLCFLYWKVGRYGFDGYILRYEAEAMLPFHKDPIDGKMWRLNITLWGRSMFFIKRGGGHSVGWKSTMRLINLFRPDIQSHALKVYTRTYKLSLGFAKFNKQ